METADSRTGPLSKLAVKPKSTQTKPKTPGTPHRDGCMPLSLLLRAPQMSFESRENKIADRSRSRSSRAAYRAASLRLCRERRRAFPHRVQLQSRKRIAPFASPQPLTLAHGAI